jgi:predicted secreted protein
VASLDLSFESIALFLCVFFWFVFFGVKAKREKEKPECGSDRRVPKKMAFTLSTLTTSLSPSLIEDFITFSLKPYLGN